MINLRHFLLLLAGMAGMRPCFAQVRLQQEGSTVRLSNGIVALHIEKSTGHVLNMHLAGQPDVLQGRRMMYFDANGNGPLHPRRDYWGLGSAQFRVVQQTPNLVEVSSTAQPSPYFPFQVSVHYVLRAGESGFYCFTTYRHTASDPAGSIGQTRFVIKLRPSLFTNYFVTRRKQGTFYPLKPGDKLHEVTNATTMFPDGSIRTKYNLASFVDHHHVYGAAGPHNGIWMISASNEFDNGGPTKQDLCVHQDDVIVLRMLQSGHFLEGSRTGLHVVGSWSKIYGPMFVYLNHGASPQAVWSDARRQARIQEAQWPYGWMRSTLYPLQRGTVSGRVVHANGKSGAGAVAVLGAPSPDWQLQGMGYLFWAHAGTDGRFTINHVRPGSYTLYVWQPGFAGTVQQNNVQVSARHATVLKPLVMRPAAEGRVLWQIGRPDRTAAGFRHGGELRQFGLWNLYRTDFPHDVNYRIGADSPAKDWNYCQPVVQHPDGTWHKPVWHIVFVQKNRLHGALTLLIGIAGASQAGGLRVTLNGKTLADFPLRSDPSVYRDGTLAGQYRLKQVTFAAGLLAAGANRIGLHLDCRQPSPSAYNKYALPRGAVMYDFIRLVHQGKPDAGEHR